MRTLSKIEKHNFQYVHRNGICCCYAVCLYTRPLVTKTIAIVCGLSKKRSRIFFLFADRVKNNLINYFSRFYRPEAVSLVIFCLFVLFIFYFFLYLEMSYLKMLDIILLNLSYLGLHFICRCIWCK